MTQVMASISLLGVRIDNVTMDGALSAIERFNESGAPHIIVTADASAIVVAQSDEEFRRIVNEADLVTPDSAGILLVSGWYGSRLKEKVSGVDLTVEIACIAAEKGYPIFLLGAAPGVAELAAENLKKRFPELNVAGTHHGFFENDEEMVRAVAESGAKVLFVAMGIPKQEKWIARNLDRLNVAVAVGVGGTFDVLSGRVNRAPEWMRKHGLEWAHRLASNPRKIGKVMTLPKFLWLVIVDRMFGSR
ncbi:MAG: WecB/TagA/CpsF family glycosyltransferase [Armatimonadetes bacterium]|nr:WecB/TagA/CpsF family glycosyltransferase [Armatimonadota bacterium]